MKMKNGYFYSKYTACVFAQLFLCIGISLVAQPISAQTTFLTTQFNNITPTGCSNNYSAGCSMNTSAGGTYLMIASPTGTGDNFFRFRSSGGTERQPPSNGDVIGLNQASPHTNIQDGNANAFKITGANTAHAYVFKVDEDIDNIAIFEIQSTTIRSISTVSRNPSSTVYPGQNVTITATLDGAFNTGQAAYLRYSTDGFSTSTIIKMAGSGTTYTADIPASVNNAGVSVSYYTFTSGDVSSISSANADLYTINLNNNSGSNYSYTVASTWESSSTGNWSAAATWLGGAVPADDQPVTIKNGHNITVDDDINIATLTIETGATLTADDGAVRNINIANTGSIINNGTFTSNNEIINCAGNCTFSGVIAMNDLIANGGITFGSTSTINGTFQINFSGFAFDSPTYGAAATLLYNTGGTFNRNAEWSATSGAGYPNHVQISNNTTFQLANGSNDARQIAGNLTIDNGSSLSMESMTGNFRVLGNLTNNGTLTLSSALGGDLQLGGNWTKGNTATFTPNNRAVTFNGSSTQTIRVTGGGTEEFDFLVVNNTAANVQLSNAPSTNVNVHGATADVLQLLAGNIDLNGQMMTLTGSGGNIQVDGAARTITGSVGSIFKISCATSTTCKNLNATNSGTFVLDTDVTMELENGGINFGSGISTINGTLALKSASFVDTNSPTYGTSSLLNYNTGGSFNRNIEWNDASLNDVTITAGTTLNFGNEDPTSKRSLSGDLLIEGSLEMNGSTTNLSDSLTIGGDCTIASGGSLTLSNSMGGDLKLKGNFTNNGTFTGNERPVLFEGSSVQQLDGNTVTTIDYLHLTNTGGGLTLQQTVNVDNELHLSNGIMTTDAANQLILLENAIMGVGAEGSTSSYVNGPMVKKTNSTNAFTFPTGKNGILAQIGISPQSADATDFTAEYVNESAHPTYDQTSLAASIHHVSEIEYWLLDRSSAGTAANATVTLHWNSHSDVSSSSSDHNALRVARWNGSQWVNEGGNAINTGIPGSVTSDIISSFSPFTLATTIEDNVLPVELLRFDAERLPNNEVRVFWETIQEIEHDFFVVEHSKDGESFEEIGVIQGQGNSQVLQAYEFIDTEPYHGINYYRLKDVAFDGTVGFSKIISVFIEGDHGLDIALFPNPSYGAATLEIWSDVQGQHELTIFDMAGKVILKQAINSNSQLWEGSIQLSTLPKGTYLIRVSNQQTSRSRKFIRL
ncbi:MAG: T9SS type A sorting domain-containing protein [Flammeovirgaceae bacterium]